MSEKIDAADLASLIEEEAEDECFFKAQVSGEAWDENEAGETSVVNVNRGKGFEEAIEVVNDEGTTYYIGPFELEQESGEDDEKFLMFTCTGQFFVQADDD